MRGFAIDFDASLGTDIYASRDDLGEAGKLNRAIPASSVTLRYHLAKTTDHSAHILEPVLQLSWADTVGDTPRNEDSTRSEFDEGNLLSFSRFNGQDAVETGFRTTMGLNYSHTGTAGWHYTLSAGKSFHERADDDFAATTGLANRSSDWLLGAQVKFNDALTLNNRAIVQDDLKFQRNDLRLAYQTTDWRLASSYYWSQPDTDLPEADFAELTLDGNYQFDRYWSAQGDWRYDFNEGTAARAGFGLSYENECIVVGATLSRRFTSSTNLDPTTDFGLTVSLKGFSTGRSRDTITKSHRCN
jgi:LPS-assembly protein